MDRRSRIDVNRGAQGELDINCWRIGHGLLKSTTGTELAIRRAVEVRRLLISLNVDPERIRLFYRGAGNFVANNSTPEGKAMNRRVEIELRKW